MKKPVKILCIVVCVAILGFLLYLAAAFWGNPVSWLLARSTSTNYLEDNLPNTDFEITKVGYNFKTGDYYAWAVSPTSQDSYFTIYCDGWGRYRYDTLENIGNMSNTISRLDENYRELVKSKLNEGSGPFDLSIAFGELRIAGVYEVFSYTDEEGNLKNYSLDKAYGLDRDTLVLDKEYDIREIGKESGRIVLYIHDPVVSVERMAELLLEVKAYLEENQIPFHAIDFHLCEPRNEQGQNVGDQISVYDFLCSDIYEENLTDRLQENWEVVQEHHAIQDGYKNTLEHISLTFDEISPKAENTTYLNLSVSVSPNNGCTIIRAQDISASFPIDIKIYNLSNISINIDGIETPLINAFQQELVTPEEIFAFAQIDARKGNCDIESISIQGLTYHIFTYPMYDLAVVYDILETPDGKQHLIHTMSFDMAYRYKLEDKQIIYTDDKTGKALDRENWGLTFDTVAVDPTSMTVSCTQEGGQQFGQLDIEEFLLYSYESNELLGEFGKVENGTIQMDATSDIIIDWTTSHGELSPGTYFIRLYINDNYDPSVIHPLTKNYHDRQTYDIEFSLT